MEILKILLVGAPRLLHGDGAYASPSVQVDNVYAIETTRLPDGLAGPHWKMCFNSQLGGDPFRAEHDGVNQIIVWCDPGKHADWLKRVEAAVAKTNETIGTTSPE